MDECLNFNPEHRPALSMVRARIEPRGLDPDNMHFKGMRKVVPNARLPWHNNDRGLMHRLVTNFRDDYRIGLARAQVRPRPALPP